jgi:signal transduction histidine kinase
MRGLTIAVAALVCGAVVAAIELASDHHGTPVVWAVFAPAVGWSFVATGLYASHRRPQNRVGALMVLLGFAWFVFTLDASDVPLVYTLSAVFGGLWGGVFLHLGLSFPSGRLAEPLDRALALAGYVLFPLAFVPALMFSTPHQLGCDECPQSLIFIRDDPDLAKVLTALGAAVYFVLFAVVLVWAVRRWRGTGEFERLQLTPVYVFSLLTFLSVSVARAGAGDAAWWVAFVATLMTPFAFLGGLLRSHVVHLADELRESLEELRESRARVVAAGDAARRQLERDLHDGAQSRLVGLALLLRLARNRASDPEQAALLERASGELSASLDELRELARGIHPAVLTDRGLEPALDALVTRAPVPVTVEAKLRERLPPPVETAAYFVVSEALTNVAKYARATHATVALRRANGHLMVEVADDGIGGASASAGSGLRGLADRVAALDGTLSLDSPSGRGTRLRAKIPVDSRGRRDTGR